MPDNSNFAYQLCVGLFPLTPSGGTAIPVLPDEFGAYLWDISSSIIPDTYDFTNIQIGATQIATIENATITQLSKTKRFDSGDVTPPQVQFAQITTAESESIVQTLSDLGQTVSDCFKALLAVGKYTGTSGGVRSYDVFHLATALLLQDGDRTAEALQRFTGGVQFQECHLPLIGKAKTKSTLSWTESTGAIALTYSA